MSAPEPISIPLESANGDAAALQNRRQRGISHTYRNPAVI